MSFRERKKGRGRRGEVVKNRKAQLAEQMFIKHEYMKALCVENKHLTMLYSLARQLRQAQQKALSDKRLKYTQRVLRFQRKELKPASKLFEEALQGGTMLTEL